MNDSKKSLKLPVTFFVISLTVFLLSIVLVTSGNDLAYACSCMQPLSPDEEMENFDVVFSGKVTKVEEKQDGFWNQSTGTKISTFDVYTIWKGDKKDTMTVWTDELSSCGVFFEENKEYVVYAFTSSDYGDNLSTSICSRTGFLSDAIEEFDELGPGYSPKFDIGRLLPPLKQLMTGVPAEKIQCNEGLNHIIKYDGTPACLKSKSIEKLNERGWILEVVNTLQIEKEGKYPIDSFEIPYTITGANLYKIISDTEASLLIINLENAIDDGELVITIPRELLDATHESGVDIDFFVLVDEEEIEFDEEKNSIERTLTIQFDSGAHLIEIIAPFW